MLPRPFTGNAFLWLWSVVHSLVTLSFGSLIVAAFPGEKLINHWSTFHSSETQRGERLILENSGRSAVHAQSVTVGTSARRTSQSGWAARGSCLENDGEDGVDRRRRRRRRARFCCWRSSRLIERCDPETAYPVGRIRWTVPFS